jgi:hypothetical protein
LKSSKYIENFFRLAYSADSRQGSLLSFAGKKEKIEKAGKRQRRNPAE